MVVLRGGWGSYERGIPVHVGGREGTGDLTQCRMFTRTGLIFKETDRPLSCVLLILRKRRPTALVHFLNSENENRPILVAVFLNSENTDRSTLEPECS